MHGQRATTGQDWWLKKFSPQGVENTENRDQIFDAGGNATDQPLDATFINDGSLIFGGLDEMAGSRRGFVLRKFSTSGVQDTNNWPKDFDGGNNRIDTVTAVAATTDGDVYIADEINPGAGNTNAWIKKFSADGTEDTTDWNKVFNAAATGGKQVNSIVLELSL